MKIRNIITPALGLIFTLSAGGLVAGTNLSDAIDANEVPAELEQREDEDINRADPADRNDTPAILEERQEEEEWRDDYDGSQFDTKKLQNKSDVIE